MSVNKKIKNSNNYLGSKIKSRPNPKKEIGIDTTNNLSREIINSVTNGYIDISKIESFSSVAQTREQVYKLIDTMAEDSSISSILETYAEDITAANDEGKIFWCESDDEEVSKYINYLLEAIRADKNAYTWAYSLIKYGDLYLRLYRESDYGDDLLFGQDDDTNEKRTLNEDLKSDGSQKDDLKENVNLILHKENDNYVTYLEKVKNPGEMFDLTRFGKTMGYVKAPVNLQNDSFRLTSTFLDYNLNKKDVEIYSPTDFVHMSLDDNSSRISEEVKIKVEDKEGTEKTLTYDVKRGQSILANLFKIWRELSLLEDSVLLNRTTKSSIIRMIQVEVGDMPKEQVGAHLQSLKQIIEQKAALDTDKSMVEYTNPGPIENNIYIPTRQGIGAITSTQIGGDVDPKQLTDLDWFNNKLYGAVRAPKQYFGFTDDSAGFNGGSSLSIISSRYGKAVLRYQVVMCQGITDAINLILINRGMNSYINNFKIKMNPPVTQEEIDKRENLSNRIRNISDIMNTLSDISNPSIKLNILKSLLSGCISDTAVLELIQDQIDELEKEKSKTDNDSKDNKSNDNNNSNEETTASDDIMSFNQSDVNNDEESSEEQQEENPEAETSQEISASQQQGEESSTEESPENGEESYLPSPAELNLDLTSNS